MARATSDGGKGKAASGPTGSGRSTGKASSPAAKGSGAAEKPWRREHPGAYVSADQRFRIEQEGPGRWFVVDEEQLDELGLARTKGPFGTLDDAREEADRLRSMPATVSPLLPRIAAQREKHAGEGATAGAATTAKEGRATRGVRGATPAPAPPRPSAAARSGGPLGKGAHGRPAEPAAPRPPAPEPPAPEPPPPPPPPTWLERLPPDDATRARRLVTALRRLGIADAERTVRVDFEGGRPAVARSIIARRLREAAMESWKRPDAFERADDVVRGALRHAASAGISDREIAAIVDFVAHGTLAATLEQVSALERDPDAPTPLPGWRLVEHDPARPDRERRIDVSADDVVRLRLDRAPDPDPGPGT